MKLNDADGTVDTCKDCRYWYYKTETQADGRLGLKNAQCRRYPPAIGPDVAPWPHSTPDEWCGEFRP